MPEPRTNGHKNGSDAPAQTEENPANGRTAPVEDDWQPHTWDGYNDGMDYGNHPTGDLLGTLVASGAPPDAAKLLAAELNQDHVLSKLDESELWYRRYAIKNNLEIILASAPPEESIWQGERRDAAGLEGHPEPISPTLIHQLRDTADAAYERNARSRDGWQQTLLAEQQSERRIVEERDTKKQGLISKLIG